MSLLSKSIYPGLVLLILGVTLSFSNAFAASQHDSIKEVQNEELNTLTDQLKSISRQIESIQAENRTDSLFAEDTVFVSFMGHDLWPVYLSFGPLTPQDRVDRLKNNIKEIPLFSLGSTFDSLKMVNHQRDIKIMNGEKVLFYVTHRDAELLETDVETIANEYIGILQNNVHTDQLIENNKDLIWRIAKTAVILVILGLIIKLINFGYRKLKLYIAHIRGSRIKGFKIKTFEIINEQQVLRILFIGAKILRLFFIITFIYISLPLIFGLFPWTEALAETLLGYVLDPLKQYLWAFVNYIPNIISIALISYIGSFIIKLVTYFAKEVENENLTLPGFYPEWARPTFNLVRFAIYIILLIFIFPFLPGSDSAIFKGVSVFVGILITMGSSSSVANIVSGLILTYMRPYKKGDRIQVDTIMGFVIEKTLLVTRLRTSKQEIITIPNSKILATNIINYSTSIQENDGVVIHSKITIGYDVPWRKVHKALLKSANQIDTISKIPKPFVLQTALNDFSVEYEINAYITDVKTLIGTHSQLHEYIQDVFRDEGIEIMSPHFSAIRDGSEITIPKKVKEDKTFKSEQVEENAPELDEIEKEEAEKAEKKANAKKSAIPTSFSEILEKVQKTSSDEAEKGDDSSDEKSKEEKTEPKKKDSKK